MNADGSNILQLARGCVSYFSPDGSQILYGVYCNETDAIWLMNSDGSDQREIVSGHECKNATWSPDGTKIVFQETQGSTTDGPFALYIMDLENPDNSQWQLLVDYNQNAITPAWQPTQQATTSSFLEQGFTIADDDAKLIYIPERTFLRGLSKEQLNLIISMCPDCKRDYVDDEMPQTSIYLDSFWIDEKEVTNAQFARFVDETGYITSAEKKLNDATYVFDMGIKGFVFTADADWQHPHGKSSNINGLDSLPVTQVSWDDANAYCNWAGHRLPTEAEWEKAARGTDGALFVWGNEPPSGQLLNFNLQFQGPRPVESYDMGVSPYGIYNMAGNVWEWVSDYYSETYFQVAPDRNPSGPMSGDGHVLRGGSWASEYKDLNLVTATSRIWNRSYTRSDVLGFRCAKDGTP